MLCFANAAVHVNNDYQVIFPPSTQYVALTITSANSPTWPIATTATAAMTFARAPT